MASKVLKFSFHILFFLTPLIFTPYNHELFEYNKMMLTYLLTVLIVSSWIIKMILEKELILKKTPLDIPILIFFASQVISTVFSVDVHTSIWGYYSRSNGGLLSITAYILLYYALVSNFKADDAIKFLKTAVIGGLLVSLWAIPEHFGVSPSCVLLVNRFAADCWVQDVQARVFATLGQPNWLGAYLSMLIFPTIYFYLTAKTLKSRILYLLSCILFYLALTFTFSRGATLGFVSGLLVFAASYFIFCHPDGKSRKISGLVPVLSHLRDRFFASFRITQTKSLLIVLISFLLVNLLFGSAWTRFKLFWQAPPPPKLTQAVGTQLETGGTESGQIRLIVWRGAIDIFKAYPIFGSGVETFAYTYYNFRPVQHNFVSEWDFLYNKAHNEYLNYLATTGLVGFLSYMAVIMGFIVYGIWSMVNRQKDKPSTINHLLLTSLLAGYTSYLIQNIFGFSVVIIALLFYLFPAFAFLAIDELKPVSISKSFLLGIPFAISRIILKREFNRILFASLVLALGVYLIFTIYRFWLADTYFKNGTAYSDSGNPGQAYNLLIKAVNINSGEPLYRSELGYAAASAALALSQEDTSRSAQLVSQAEEQTEIAIKTSPKNLSLLRTAVRTYFELSFLDPKYEKLTLDAVDKSTLLAPTDPKILYNKSLILDQLQKTDEAIKVLQKTVELKPNYAEAHFSLGEYYQKQDKMQEAIKEFETVLKLTPNNPEAIAKLKELK